MKFVLSVLLVATLVLPAGMIQAAQKKGYPPNTYRTCEECLKALKEGRGYYEPTYFSDARKKPSRPVAFTRGLEADACVPLKVVGGFVLFVPQKAGTLYDWDKDNKPIRRSDCGNEAPGEPCYPKAEKAEVLSSRPEASPTSVSVEQSSETPSPPPPPAQQSQTVRNDGEGDAVAVQGSGNTVNFRKEIREVVERVEPALVEREGWSTGAKVAMGALIAGAVVAVVYFLTKKDKKTTTEPLKSGGNGPRQ